MHVVLQNPADGSEIREVSAQIDTAADTTVLPDAVVQALALPQIGTSLVGGLAGVTMSLPTYAVALGIRDLSPQAYKVLASADEKWVLLGRDVLNSYRLLLDGPKLLLEIE